jgi:hypothetical protein
MELEEDEDLLDGLQTPPDSSYLTHEKELDEISVQSTPMFNKKQDQMCNKYK